MDVLLWNVHTFQVGPQQGNIISTFIEGSQCLDHTKSLAHFHNSLTWKRTLSLTLVNATK